MQSNKNMHPQKLGKLLGVHITLCGVLFLTLGYFLYSARYSLGDEPTIAVKFLLKLDMDRNPHS